MRKSNEICTVTGARAHATHAPDSRAGLCTATQRQNQSGAICVACHLSFFHSHLLASLFPLPPRAQNIVTGPSLTRLKWLLKLPRFPFLARARVADVAWPAVAACQNQAWRAISNWADCARFSLSSIIHFRRRARSNPEISVLRRQGASGLLWPWTWHDLQWVILSSCCWIQHREPLGLSRDYCMRFPWLCLRTQE